ncbi:Hachiman antiphage defense system protein HamA [Micavibrio aeruginosavorus]|uniref:Anti-bacteriophage protein A/HamA C-terminal domain-containing protein n=1 Tax=Micavibrio aeruginosavorus (strain ARL-13) TaxID=856793 RepID=G2KNQ6_MICAA|nr:Hachiman antiphage defense system protein HamA [Micavibrio aeruginosavorus]AEP10301.1 hypothetical protein MICA_1993 [Micavibrio aeruginosavorus ARL-13]
MESHTNTPLTGVVIEKSEDGNTLCKIENFSESLQEKIRQNLTAIAHGKSTSEEPIPQYAYKPTLKNFMDRYTSKDENTKKGLIGELLAHVLIPDIFQNLTSLSVYFNKEERSIKKGFDIIYCDLSEKSVWYSEVKSGHKNANDDSNEANTVLLERANTDLRDKFLEGRGSLWDSALIDVTLVLGSAQSITVKQLLSLDSPLNDAGATSKDKNAILISVLYETPTSPVSLKSLQGFFSKIKDSAHFKEIIVFSIQKETHQKVANFLEKEAENA